MRRFRFLSPVVAFLVLVPLMGGLQAARPPQRIRLPHGFSPEGISIRHGRYLFVGSLSNGAIYRANARTGNGALFIEGQEGRSATGLKVRHRKLYVSGGETGQAYVYNAYSGKELATFQLTEDSTFVNDVVVTKDAAWFTDSINPVLYRVALGPRGVPRGPRHVRTVDLKGVDYRPGFNVNGIDAKRNGEKLILVQSNTGLLFKVDAGSGRARRIDLGGERVRNGDGILLDGSTLYVVQNMNNQLSVVKLERDLESGDVVRRIRDDDFDVPTTVAKKDGFLYIVNARFSTPPTPTTRYWVAVIPVPSGPQKEFSWKLKPTGTDAQLRGLDAVSFKVAWASGSEGTVLRTVNGGRSWRQVSPRGTGDLEFRDIEAFGRRRATVLAIGPGDASRIYRTADGGATWKLVFRNRDERAFYDCLAFYNHDRGLALSDPVNGKFRILLTTNGGRSWRVVPRRGMPEALTGEFAFAASGTCLVTGARHTAWFATGGADEARVFRSRNGGRRWSAATTPVRSTESGGIFSLAFTGAQRGLAVGGDFLTPDEAIDALALTSDGGSSWKLTRGRAPGGYRSGSAWAPRLRRTAIVVGPTGSDVSTDGGHNWRLFDDGSFDSVDCAPRGGCWASGAEGRAARLVVSP